MLCEKERLFVTSNFSFSHNVFHSYVSLVHQNAALCGKLVLRHEITDPMAKSFGSGQPAQSALRRLTWVKCRLI